ncbi:MAG: prephenate dehydrogenase, partial [Limisphaerales bacterium]
AVFIGSHPMAGSEKTGPAAAREGLFDKAVCILTPIANTPADPLQQLDSFWAAVGCKTLRLTPEEHDDLTGRCSHLPHVVAAGLANYVLSPTHAPEQAELCATGFRDTTRVASGSIEMWRDIVMQNREHLQRVLGVFVEDLEEFRRAVSEGDEAAVVDFFETAKKRRDAWQEEFNKHTES